ncbi:MAG TPA: xanthine dehydrogenase family protein molybdopterin-binding subunit, partial [Methylomirabilota bacterium]
EDPRYLRGDGRFVDDIKLPGMLHVAFVRSPHAHARIAATRTDAARRLPGVAHVLAFGDLERWMKPLPLFGAIPPGLAARVAVTMKQPHQLAMCRDEARHVGEIVAMVLAGSRAVAEDGAELVEVDYEPLPVLADVEAAARPDAPVLYPAWGDNIALSFKTGFGDAEAAFRQADARVRERFVIPRYVGMPIETRGVVAQWDPRDGTLTTWNGTQVVHFVQQGLVAALGLPPHKIRVVAPDVGGGFGTKANGYAEDLLIPAAAILARRPVKWTEDRREHMMGSAHARAQVHDIEIAARRDGTMLAVRDRIWVDLGAYNSWGIVLPYNTVAHLLGPHRVPNLDVECLGVVTTKTPNAPYRGAGRPETVFAMDRIVDCLARELAMDPAELRRRNFLSAADLPYELHIPYRDGNPLVYDSGDFKAGLEAALRAIGYDALRAEQARLRERGIHRGIGISSYVEGTAIGPYEGATVRLDASGHAVVATGACCQGQGHETSFAQIAADALGIPLEAVTIVGGDTAAIPFGVGTFASRSAVNAGSSIHEASGRVKDKLVAAAAALLEAAPADIEVTDGVVTVRGVPGSATPLASVIRAAIPTFAKPGVASPDFEATVYHHQPTVTYTSATHVAVVDVDTGTGAVTLVRYLVAHDCGTLINPVIVEGQIHGGVAQGVGGGLLEEMVYDEQAQLLTGTFMD